MVRKARSLQGLLFRLGQCRKQKTGEYCNNGNDDQELNQRKCARPCHGGSSETQPLVVPTCRTGFAWLCRDHRNIRRRGRTVSPSAAGSPTLSMSHRVVNGANG